MRMFRHIRNSHLKSPMTPRSAPAISARKEPQQGRSKNLVTAILEAAVRILRTEGAVHFTMAHIAERAGVSVGSLYQYFPNKQAVLFRLQTAEWQDNAAFLGGILAERSKSPQLRLKAMILHFFRSECEEAPFRRALDDAAPFYRRAPEAQAQRKHVMKIMKAFIAEAIPNAVPATQSFAAEFVLATISALGKHVSEKDGADARVDRFAAATSDMLCDWLAQKNARQVSDA